MKVTARYCEGDRALRPLNVQFYLKAENRRSRFHTNSIHPSCHVLKVLYFTRFHFQLPAWASVCKWFSIEMATEGLSPAPAQAMRDTSVSCVLKAGLSKFSLHADVTRCQRMRKSLAKSFRLSRPSTSSCLIAFYSIIC